MKSLPDSFTTRRTWVKRFVLGTVASLSAPRWAGTLLAVPGDPADAAVLGLKIADYPPLAEPGGSIQLVFNEIFKPFTVNRVSADRFVALDSICTHAQCTVGRFIVADQQMRCPCHGSRYDVEGRVFRDEHGQSTEPAQADLHRFESAFDSANGVVSVTIPGLALAIRSLTVQEKKDDGTLRLKLVFPVTAFSIYEVRYSAELGQPTEAVAFSTTATGPASRKSLTPDRDGDTAVYVDASGPRGFFEVGLKLTAP